MWLTDVFIRFGHIQKRAASKQEVLMIKFYSWFYCLLYITVWKKTTLKQLFHSCIVHILLVCCCLDKAQSLSEKGRNFCLCLCVYYLDRVTAGNTDQTWASFFLYRISTKLAGVKMTQDPPFQYVLLILTLSRKVIVQALSMMLIKKKKEYISNSRG